MTVVDQSPSLGQESFLLVDLIEMYRRMLVVRMFEERAARLYKDGEVPGFVHVSVGQEASSVGICWPLRDSDGIVSTHRGHGHCLAKGADPGSMFAELMGRSTGTGGGMGGSMHIADFDHGVYGANGIVGAGLPIAVGVAQGFRQLGRDDVVVAFFGDGAIAQGTFHESMNLAALWKLPVLFACENNGYAEFSPTAMQHPVSITDRALAYGIEAVSVDGNDVQAVASTVAGLVERMRVGGGPFLMESVTYRRRGHYEGDPTAYRVDGELEQWIARDPLTALSAKIDARGGRVERERVECLVAEQMAEAEERASNASYPELADMFAAVECPHQVLAGDQRVLPPERQPEKYRIMDALHDGLRDSLAEDPSVFIAGIDVGAGGNIFGLTRGLEAQYPGRVLDTPISESAIVGMAVGSAMTGCKPVVEIMYLDFIGVCFDQIMNQAAKLHFMTGGRAPMSLVIRSQFGSGRSSGAQHSQSLEGLVSQIPGLTVVMPSTTEDAYGLMRTAIEDPNPVIFIEHRLTYGKKGPQCASDHRVPIGKAAIRRLGNDVTVVSWSRMVDVALEAAAVMASRGVDVEVLDLRTVSPLDEESIVSSLRKTGRLVIVQESAGAGIGAEVAALVSDVAIWSLNAPIKRVSPPFTPAPYSAPLEALWLPGPDEVVAAIEEVMEA